MSAMSSSSLFAQGYEGPLTNERQITLARTAAPGTVTAGASYWVLGSKGYEQAIEGDNGFNCLVLRRFSVIFDQQKDLYDWDGLIAPICYDPVASAGAPLMEQFMRAELGSQGASHDEVKRAVFDAYAEGRLPAPQSVSFAYMYSAEQRLTPRVGHWHPHIMVYAPGYANSMLGNNALTSGDPIVFEASGTPRAVIAIPINGRTSHIHIDPVAEP